MGYESVASIRVFFRETDQSMQTTNGRYFKPGCEGMKASLITFGQVGAE